MKTIMKKNILNVIVTIFLGMQCGNVFSMIKPIQNIPTQITIFDRESNHSSANYAKAFSCTIAEMIKKDVFNYTTDATKFNAQAFLNLCKVEKNPNTTVDGAKTFYARYVRWVTEVKKYSTKNDDLIIANNLLGELSSIICIAIAAWHNQFGNQQEAKTVVTTLMQTIQNNYMPTDKTNTSAAHRFLTKQINLIFTGKVFNFETNKEIITDFKTLFLKNYFDVQSNNQIDIDEEFDASTKNVQIKTKASFIRKACSDIAWSAAIGTVVYFSLWHAGCQSAELVENNCPFNQEIHLEVPATILTTLVAKKILDGANYLKNKILRVK